MKSMKIALMIALFAVMQVMGLEKPATPQTDSEILQIQKTLQAVGQEHLAAQKHLGATATQSIQDQITKLKSKLDAILTPEQKAQIKNQIEQIKLNIRNYVNKATAPAA